MQLQCWVDETEAEHFQVLSCSLNASLCALKLKDLTTCIRHSTKALKLDTKSIKALYRRGTAYLEKDLAKAKTDFMLAKELDPSNKGKAMHSKQSESDRYNWN